MRKRNVTFANSDRVESECGRTSESIALHPDERRPAPHERSKQSGGMPEQKRRSFRYSLRSLLVASAVVAVVAMIYRELHVPPLNRIPGLSIETESETSPEVLFDQNATPDTVELLLSNLDEGSTLWFYDSQKEAISDPGVFVTIASLNGKLFVEFGNHGWSSDWAEIPRDELSEYLWACRADNQKGKPRFYRTAGMHLRREVHPTIRVTDEAQQSIQSHILKRTKATRDE